MFFCVTAARFFFSPFYLFTSNFEASGLQPFINHHKVHRFLLLTCAFTNLLLSSSSSVSRAVDRCLIIPAASSRLLIIPFDLST